MKIDIPLKSQINKIFTLALLVAIAANIFIGVVVSYTMAKSELQKTKDTLLSSAEVQSDKLIPLMLVSDLYGSLDDELQLIKIKEDLSNIFINTDSKCNSINCSSYENGYLQIEHRISSLESRLGYLTKIKKIEQKVLSIDSLILILLISLTFIATISVLLVIINRFIKTHLSNPINNIDQLFKPIIENQSSKEITPNYKIKEINNLVRNLKVVFDLLQNEKKEAIFAKSFRKVSHDLKSPVMALKISMEALSNVEESKKALMKQAMSRIESIAKYTLDTSKSFASSSKNVLNIDQLLKLKRIEYYSKEILFSTNPKCKELCIKDNSTLVEIESIISNLINNSVEAHANVITVTYNKQAQGVYIEVRDNGCGIKKDQLSKIGQNGITLKKSGNGIALFNAKNFLSEVGGTLEIDSILSVGTKVTIFLPKTVLFELDKDNDQEPMYL